jgi:hypothetical protein
MRRAHGLAARFRLCGEGGTGFDEDLTIWITDGPGPGCVGSV